MFLTRLLRNKRLWILIVCAFVALQVSLLKKSAKEDSTYQPTRPAFLNGIPLGVWIHRTPATPATEKPTKKSIVIFKPAAPKEKLQPGILPRENTNEREGDLPKLDAFQNSNDANSLNIDPYKDINPGLCFDVEIQSSADPILTLFTTFSAQSNSTWAIQNMLKNRALLGPSVRAMYYYVPKEKGIEVFQRLAISCGIHVYPAPAIHEHTKLPIFKDMWLHAQRVSKTDFHAYANADILFTKDLIETLKFLQPKLEYLDDKNYLIVGQRTDYHFTMPHDVSTLKEVRELAENAPKSESDAQDYFITANGHYPWSDIPEFVVGNVLYDNWLVMNAFTQNMAVFDVTSTITALHQSDASGKNRYHDYDINQQLAGNTTRLLLGMTKCAHFYTDWIQSAKQRRPLLIEKKGEHTPCWVHFKKFGIDKDMFLKLIPGVSG